MPKEVSTWKPYGAASSTRPYSRLGEGAAVGSAAVGSAGVVRTRLSAFVAEHQPDEIIVTSQIWDHAARKRSYEILAGLVA